MANVTERVAQVRNATYGRDVRESLASSIEDMNQEVEIATGNYATAQAAAEQVLASAGPAAEAANLAANAANTSAQAAGSAANNANEKAANLIAATTLEKLGLSAESTPAEAIDAIIDLLSGKLSATEINPIPVSLGGTGGTDIPSVRDAWGLGDTDGELPVQNGGTGATSSAQAIKNLGAAPALHYHPGKALVSAADWQMGVSKKLIDIAKYVLYQVRLNGISTPLIGTRTGSYLCAVGAYCNTSDNQRIYTARFKINGTTVTLEETSGITHLDKGSHGEWTGYGVSYLIGII